MFGKPQPQAKIRQGCHKVAEGVDDIRRGVGEQAQLWEQGLVAKGRQKYAHAKEGIHHAEAVWETRKRQVEEEVAQGVRRAHEAVVNKEKVVEQEAHHARKRVDSAVDHTTGVLTEGKRRAVDFYRDLEQVALDQWDKFRDVGTRLLYGLFQRDWIYTDIPPTPTWNKLFAPPVPAEAPCEPPSSSDWRDHPSRTCRVDQDPKWVMVTDDSVLSVLLGLDPPWQNLLNLPQCLDQHHHLPAAVAPDHSPEQATGYLGILAGSGNEHSGTTRQRLDHCTVTQEQLADLGGAWRALVRDIEGDLRPNWFSGGWVRPMQYPFTLYFRPNITDTTFRNGQSFRGETTDKDPLTSGGPFHRMVVYEPNMVQLDLDLKLLQKQLGDEVSPIILAGAITEYPLEMWVRSLDHPHSQLLRWEEQNVNGLTVRKLSRLATKWRNIETGVPPTWSSATSRWYRKFQEGMGHVSQDAQGWGNEAQTHCTVTKERLRNSAQELETQGRSLAESGVHQATSAGRQLRSEWSAKSHDEKHYISRGLKDHFGRSNTGVDSKLQQTVGYPSLPSSPDPLSKSSISWSELVGSVLLVWVLYHLVRLFFRIHPVQLIPGLGHPGEHQARFPHPGYSQHHVVRGVSSVHSTRVSSHHTKKGHTKATSTTIVDSTETTVKRSQSNYSDDDHSAESTSQVSTLQDPLGLPADGIALTGQWNHLRDILVHFPILILLVTVLEMNHYSTLLSGYLLVVFGCGALLHYYHPYIIRFYPSLCKLPLVGEGNSGLYLMWSSILLAGVVGFIGGLIY
ncbi:hypothetical protein IWQ61_005506 [Dispira simplex]|nr:hypothetical protein IWQ61_005506 [Dispira simplex]